MTNNYIYSFVTYMDNDTMEKEFIEYCQECWYLYNTGSLLLGLYGWDEMIIPVKQDIVCDGCGITVSPNLVTA